MASQPRMVVANGVELCVQTFGDPASPAILLIAGLASSMDWWHEEFCERLLAAEVPGARLLPLEGVGREMPPRAVWDQVIGAILEHTR